VEQSDNPSQRTLRKLRDRYPSTPFIALGQTVWWDEPMKAVLTELLEQAGLYATFVLGVHDTDYFAKVHTILSGESRFELLPHNDGVTQDLWSAAGEISTLFGSECLPTRHDLTRHGVPLRALARWSGVELREFLSEHTAAWGWRGLVFKATPGTVMNEMHLAEVAPGIRAMLEYGFENTIRAIETPEVAEQARRFADMLLDACFECCRDDPRATLTTLYKAMLPRLFSLLMGRQCPPYPVTSSSELLRFGPDTVDLPRFKLLDVFLDPSTRPVAERAYDQAVAGSEMYTLSQFGVGALPFDVVIPGTGRGTLKVTLRAVHIEAREPIRIRTPRPITSARSLASLLSAYFGHDVILVGKAVTLVAMLAREFIFVFNEEGSAYVRRTRMMNDALKASGLLDGIHPILRLHYQTWDSAQGVGTQVALPEPMREPFGASSMTMDRLSQSWRQVVAEQERLLATLADIRSPRGMLEFLCRENPGMWRCACRRHAELTDQIMKLAQEREALMAEAYSLHEDLIHLGNAIATTELERGAHFRSVSRWTPEETARREALGRTLEELHETRRQVERKLRQNQRARLAWGHRDEIERLRCDRRDIELRAEKARLDLVRNAILTARGLQHADHRPSAWWLPFVDPSGEWFRRVVVTTQAYIEPLLTEDAQYWGEDLSS